ncbi:hypothetical protein ACFWPQ_46330 [Streptomyces sp. NPDC058464]|uniref:hypothetical protein n=1 Tax=Streptomyces sp. NPDC058464 TaxID=3346511 RepID=UPI003666DDD0
MGDPFAGRLCARSNTTHLALNGLILDTRTVNEAEEIQEPVPLFLFPSHVPAFQPQLAPRQIYCHQADRAS